jgi:hypothetical protein
MPRFFVRVYFLAVFGGVVCILGTTGRAQGQDTTTIAEQNRSEAVLSTNVGSFASRPSHVDTFAAFVREIGADDLAARKEAITGEKYARVDWKTMNRTFIGLTDDEWNSTYSILLEGSQRVANWGDEMQESLGWKDGLFEANHAQPVTKQMARFDALNDSGDSIVYGTMARLQEKLGDGAFGRLDSFVYQREGGERSVNRGPIKRGPIQTAKATPVALMATRK